MSGEKLRVAKLAVEEAIGRLQPDDRFSVVVYDDVVDVVIESTPASAEARRGAIERLRTIEARGSTNLGEGWLRGCEQVAGHLAEAGVNRCLLLTDGLANVGITDAGRARPPRRRAARPRRLDLDLRRRQRLRRAAAPGARRRRRRPLLLHRRRARRSATRSPPRSARRSRSWPATSQLEITARDDIRIEPISPYPATTRGNRTIVALGDLGSEQVVEVVLRLSFPYGDLGRETGAIVALADRDGVFAARRDRPRRNPSG